jgi:soluble lytic murein transglycosylase-like protein
MHDVLTPSSDCLSKSPPAFPCRPDPTVHKDSSGFQRKSCTCASADAIAWLRSRRTIPGVIAAIAPSACQMVTSTAFELTARAQSVTRSESIDRFAKFVDEAPDRLSVPARWIGAVMQIESGGNKRATSSRSAMGLMQLMPGAWVVLGVRYGPGLDPFDPRDHIVAGTWWWKQMHDRFGSAGFLAAYHAGPTRYEPHLATGQRLPPETTAYSGSHAIAR